MCVWEREMKKKIKSNVRTLYKWWSFCTNMLLTSITKLNKFSELGCVRFFFCSFHSSFLVVVVHWMNMMITEKNWYKLQNDYNIRCRYQEMSSLITAFPYSFVYIKDWSWNEIPTRATSIDRKKNYLRKAFQKKKRKIKSIIQIILTYVHTYIHTHTEWDLSCIYIV